jgi:hypothetical protein
VARRKKTWTIAEIEDGDLLIGGTVVEHGHPKTITGPIDQILKGD